jgi:hypothetical protein
MSARACRKKNFEVARAGSELIEDVKSFTQKAEGRGRLTEMPILGDENRVEAEEVQVDAIARARQRFVQHGRVE